MSCDGNSGAQICLRKARVMISHRCSCRKSSGDHQDLPYSDYRTEFALFTALVATLQCLLLGGDAKPSACAPNPCDLQLGGAGVDWSTGGARSLRRCRPHDRVVANFHVIDILYGMDMPVYHLLIRSICPISVGAARIVRTLLELANSDACDAEVATRAVVRHSASARMITFALKFAGDIHVGRNSRRFEDRDFLSDGAVMAN